MTVSADEIAAMRRAVGLSALGLGSASPNPPVGCVILDATGKPAGEGYHLRKGDSHAEVHALAAAGTRAVGGTAVVTLEPCNHYGRTPPCHQALIDGGIARVLIAVIDPTSRGAGGATRLREAGIHVEVGVLADEALAVLQPWLTALDTKRPKVIWAFDNTAGGFQQLPEAVLGETGLRYQSDAVIFADGHVEEGIPGAHGQSAFNLPNAVPIAEPAKALSALYSAGARSVLLHGPVGLASSFVDGLFVDEVKSFIAADSPRMVTGDVLRDFKIQRVRRISHGVLIEAVAR